MDSCEDCSAALGRPIAAQSHSAALFPAGDGARYLSRVWREVVLRGGWRLRALRVGTHTLVATGAPRRYKGLFAKSGTNAGGLIRE